EASGNAGLESANELRGRLIALAREEQRDDSPAIIERQVVETLRSRERAATIAALRTNGVAVEYVSMDVRDERAMRSLLDRIYDEAGRIDAVFHGAGIIADKLIAGKTRESFDEVFDTKADSAYLLARYLRPETLKLLVLF